MDDKIVVRHVDKFYGRKKALADVSLTIEPGMFGLLGRNGAGKTTLMKLLASLLPKQAGEINILGIPVERRREIRSMTGYLPQDFSMYPSMTVEECLDYLGILSGMSRSLRRERKDMLLQRVNLEECRKKRVRELSGGMKRRLGIAQALIHDPKVLIVDEPTAGLDPEERIRFRNLLGEAAQERTVILSTHIVGDIEASCEDIDIMNEGSILWQGTVAELIRQAKGKVYRARIPKKSLPEVKKSYAVTGMVAGEDGITVRLLAEDAPQIPGAELTSPGLEDAYMYLLQKEGVRPEGGVL